MQHNMILQETPSIDSMFFANRWCFLGDTLNFKVKFIIIALYQQTDELWSYEEFNNLFINNLVWLRKF